MNQRWVIVLLYTHEHTWTHTHLDTRVWESLILKWWSDVEFRSECVFVSLFGPHRADSSRRRGCRLRRDGWKISARGCEEKAGRERRGGGRGVSRHAAPLGRRAMTSKALPPPYCFQRNMLLRYRETDWQSQTFIIGTRGVFVVYQVPPTQSVSLDFPLWSQSKWINFKTFPFSSSVGMFWSVLEANHKKTI